MTALPVFVLACGTLAQNPPSYKCSAAPKECSIDAFGKRVPLKARYGTAICDNMAWSGWYTNFDIGYLYLDWGHVQDTGNGLPDEVVDGFQFAYCTDGNLGGLTWACYFFDACTGWGDGCAVQEAGFLFSGLPDSPTAWLGMWIITVDLEGTGYEFLIGDVTSATHDGFGFGQVNHYTGGTVTGGCMTFPSFAGGNGDTGTEDAFDIHYPNGTYMGTYSLGGYPANPYASFMGLLFGAQDPAFHTTYAGLGLQGNHASLYTTGRWKNNEEVRFMLRRNGMPQQAVLLAGTAVYWSGLYLPALDVTLGPRMPFAATLVMAPAYCGDFAVYDLPIGPGLTNARLYIQGALTDDFNGGPLAPIDLSNVVYTN